jgi:hypothetical protein
MTEVFGPGTLVECIKNRVPDDPRADWLARTRLVLKRIYTVRAIVCGDFGTIGIDIDGADSSPYAGWDLQFFRPVRRPDSRKLLRRLAGAEGAIEGPVRSTPIPADAGLAA